MKLQPLRGMRDIVDPESTELVALSNLYRRIAGLYGYREIIPPTLERFELFALKSGEEIRRTMYVFTDKAGREVALRPEVTASVARIYLRMLRGKPKPLRLMYVANCFRYDEPQRGRYREFFQAGAELIGSSDPESDVELLLLLDEFYRTVGLDDYRVKLDDVGVHRAIMRRAGVPEEAQDRVLHLMDKDLHEEALREARRNASRPEFLESLEYLLEHRHEGPSILRPIAEKLGGEVEEAIHRLEHVVGSLEPVLGHGRLQVDLGFARGLAYYTGLIYEVMVPGLGISVAGGGRYDSLIELYGGEPTPATGFAIGLDRTLMAARSRGLRVAVEDCRRVLVIPLEKEVVSYALKALRRLHEAGARAELYHGRTRKLRRALSYASEQGYSHVVIIGSKEALEGLVTLRDMGRREQRVVGLEELAELVSCQPTRGARGL